MSWRDVRDQLTPAERAEAEEIRATIRRNRAWSLLLIAFALGNSAFVVLLLLDGAQ
jgi:hypothetical protein